jgi:hypothetical protein
MDVTAFDLMSSTVYKTAKNDGLAAGLSVPASDITITGFTLGVRRLHAATGQLSGFEEVELTDGTVLVKTSFEVEVADISAATALSAKIVGASSAVKAHTDSAMAAADWSGEPVIAVAPTLTAMVMATPQTVMTTPAPTPEPPLAPPNSGPNSGPVSGVGDPHLTNMYGERFDVYSAGVIVLLQIPRWVGPQGTLLHLEANAKRMGGMCSEVYFQIVRISGAWTNRSDGLTFIAKSDDKPNRMTWTRFGRIDIKVVNGKTREGLDYLNVYARNLGNAKHPVGGLLGGDTDTGATTPGEKCSHTLSLSTALARALT